MGAPSAGGGVDASSSGIAGLGDIFGLSQTPAYVPAQEVSTTFVSFTVTRASARDCALYGNVLHTSSSFFGDCLYVDMAACG